MNDDKKYPRYQKKYEIENNIGFHVSTSQIFGGVLQRDEAAMLRLKKEEQQKEMQLFLSRQIQEKQRKKEEEQACRRGHGYIQAENPKLEVDNALANSPRSEPELISSTILKPAESPIMKTLPRPTHEEENIKGLSMLNEVVKKLIEEKEELKNKLLEQEQKINELNVKQDQKFPKTQKPEKADPETPTKIERNEKCLARPPKSRVASAQETKLKHQHEQERAKLALIEEKLENAKKKRMQQTRNKIPHRARRVTEAQSRIDSKETLINPGRIKPGRIKTAASPSPQNSSLLDSPKSIFKPDLDRENLDTAGKSHFIYPDAEGNFPMEDEIDKFVINYEKRGSPLNNFKSSYRNTPGAPNDARFTFTAITEGSKKEPRPFVANRQGFPSDIFRLP